MATMEQPYSMALAVSSEAGEVLVDGPYGCSLSLTPEAAVQTAMHLLDQATHAKGQRILSPREP